MNNDLRHNNSDNKKCGGIDAVKEITKKNFLHLNLALTCFEDAIYDVIYFFFFFINFIEFGKYSPQMCPPAG